MSGIVKADPQVDTRSSRPIGNFAHDNLPIFIEAEITGSANLVAKSGEGRPYAIERDLQAALAEQDRQPVTEHIGAVGESV